MQSRDIIRAWSGILIGRRPNLSIEITKECPLRCPGCYAFSEGHVGAGSGGPRRDLKQLHDLRGEALIEGVMNLVRRFRPLHLSLVGGDPLVRYRELEVLVPRLLGLSPAWGQADPQHPASRSGAPGPIPTHAAPRPAPVSGLFLQIVTSAFRPLPAAWSGLDRLGLVVSVDGLQPDHDRRRQPATYARILKNIEGQHVAVHCTITSGMARRPGYLDEFVELWSANPNVRKIWFSIFTPQRGEELEEVPAPGERAAVIAALLRLRLLYPKLEMPHGMIEAFRHPPASPRDCVFARSTTTISADLRSEIGPCQFGGDPDCARCGCIASMGLAAVAAHRLPGGLRVGAIFNASAVIGTAVSSLAPSRLLRRLD